MLLFSLVIALACPPQAPADSLVIEAPGRQTALHQADLARLPRDSVRLTLHGATHVYTGVRLRDVLRSVGVPLDTLRGADLVRRLVVQATDGYRVVFTLAELAPGMGGLDVLLADSRDGGALPANEGPWRLAIPREVSGARQVRQVTLLLVRDEAR